MKSKRQSSKIKYEDINTGMCLYKFIDDENYRLFYIVSKYLSITKQKMLKCVELNKNENDELVQRQVQIPFNDYYIKNEYRFVTVKGVTKDISHEQDIYITVTKSKSDNRLCCHIRAFDTRNAPVYFETIVSKDYMAINEGEELSISPITFIINIHRFEPFYLIKHLLSLFIAGEIDEVTGFEQIPEKYQYNFKQTLFNMIEDLTNILYNNIFLSNNEKCVLIEESLKDYAIPDDKEEPVNPSLSESILTTIYEHSNITNVITRYELYEYDRTIDLSLVKLDYIFLTSRADDTTYIMLYVTGPSLTLINYDTDTEIREVVDFMLGKK